MLRRTTIVLVMTAVAAAGCGSQSDEDKVRDVTLDFVNAVVDEDYDEACDKLSTDARKEIAKAGAALDAGTCPEVLEKGFALLDSADRKRLQDADFKVTDVEVKGDRATAKVSPDLGDGDDATRLQKKGDEWFITGD
jgi:hypothetical protein